MMCMSSIPRPGLSPKIPRLAHMLLTLLSKCNSAALKSPPLKPSRSTLSTRELPSTPSIHFIFSPPSLSMLYLYINYLQIHAPPSLTHSLTHPSYKTHIEWAIKEKKRVCKCIFQLTTSTQTSSSINSNHKHHSEQLASRPMELVFYWFLLASSLA